MKKLHKCRPRLFLSTNLNYMPLSPKFVYQKTLLGIKSLVCEGELLLRPSMVNLDIWLETLSLDSPFDRPSLFASIILYKHSRFYWRESCSIFQRWEWVWRSLSSPYFKLCEHCNWSKRHSYLSAWLSGCRNQVWKEGNVLLIRYDRIACIIPLFGQSLHLNAKGLILKTM